MPRENMTGWVVKKGPDFLRRLYEMKGLRFDREGDAAAADALTAIAILEGRGSVTAAIIGKARGELDLVAYRSRRGGEAPAPEQAQLRIVPPLAGEDAELSAHMREQSSRDERVADALEAIAKHLGQIEAALWAREKRERGIEILVAAAGGKP